MFRRGRTSQRRRARRLIWIGALACAALPASASGAETIGSNLAADPVATAVDCAALACTASHQDLPAGSTAADGIVAPSPGVIVRWRIKTGAVAGDGNVWLRITSPGGAGPRTGAGTSILRSPPPNTISTFPARRSIEAGQAIGIDYEESSTAFADTAGAVSPIWDPALGDGEAPPRASSGAAGELLVNADIEADADGDGFGDETQDDCPTDPATQEACPIANQAPTAAAGPDRGVASGQAGVGLDGGGSSDPDDDPLSYRWTQTAGPAVGLAGAGTPTPSFDAPTGPALLRFRLRVCDPEPLCDNDAVWITVAEPGVDPPGPEPPVTERRSLSLSMAKRPEMYERVRVVAKGFVPSASTVQVFLNPRGRACPRMPSNRKQRARTVIPATGVQGEFKLTDRIVPNSRGRHRFCGYLGEEQGPYTRAIELRNVIHPRLRSSRARRTVARSLRRHKFAARVVKKLDRDCRRRNRATFSCRFSSAFPGYRMKGRGIVRLKRRLTYRFRVKAGGMKVTLTHKNEGRFPG